MQTIKVYIVSGQGGMYAEYPNWINNHEVVHRMEDADLVMFTGGEDVSPHLYGEPAHHSTGNNTRRDTMECAEFDYAQQLGKPILGICRGSQFMCVMAGGRLVQDQQPQPYIHKMHVIGEKDILISSTHHQAQYPFNLPDDQYKVIGWTDKLSDYHTSGAYSEMNPPKECEIVYYPAINALGIQGHPEKLNLDKKFLFNFANHDGNKKFASEIDRTLEYCNSLVTKLLTNKL